jgi:hypothetical protein
LLFGGNRDFANGFLFAEILSRFYPAGVFSFMVIHLDAWSRSHFPTDVQMHSYENVASTERKKQNWHLLEKFFKRKNVPVERASIDSCMAAEGEAAIEVLMAIYSFIHSLAYE